MSKTQNPEKLAKFWASGKSLRFKRKEIIVQDASETTPSFYWIKHGYIKVFSNTKSGNEQIHYVYGPNDLFPIGWLLSGFSHWISFMALDEVEVMVKSAEDFNAFIAKEPLLFSEITRMQQSAHERIYSLNLDTPLARIGHTLMVFAVRFGEESGTHTVVHVPLSQQEFADMVRMSRETAGKALNELEAKGCVVLGRKRILVDLSKLTELLSL